jgi:tetratricopeptide (TPR) repeat protein
VLAAPWLLLLMLEASLRAIGYGHSMDLAVREVVDGDPRWVSNPYYTWLFFDPRVARLTAPFSLPVARGSREYRVFVYGGSAAQGDPEPGFGIARMLEVLLRARYPGIGFEVVNAAATAINSHVVRSMVRDSAPLEPDAFVVYVGNNEVVGPFGAGTVLTSTTPSLPLLRAGIFLRSTRIGQFAGDTARALGKGRRPDAWQGMEMFLDRPLHASDPELGRTYEQFRRNLEDVCLVARRAGVPLVLSTVATNLRSCAPFGSVHGTALSEESRQAWEARFGAGARFQEEARWADARERYDRAAAIDPDHAELQYRLGEVAWSLGDYAASGRHYRRARDLDSLRFRADTRINQIIRAVAERAGGPGLHMVDAERALAGTAPHGVPGAESFLDHVHPTFSGNYALSTALLGPLEEALPAWVRAERAPGPPPSAEECAFRLVYTELDRYAVAATMLQRLGRPPFTRQADHEQHLARYTSEVEKLRSRAETGTTAALARYEEALSREDARWEVRERYAAILHRIGQPERSLPHWERLTVEFPRYPSFHLQLSHALRDAGRYEEATASLRNVLRYEHESVVALLGLARIELLRGRVEAARVRARRVLDLDPGNAEGHYITAKCACPREPCRPESRSRAIDHLTRALELAPDNRAVRKELAEHLARQAELLGSRGEPEAAAALIQRARELAHEVQTPGASPES